MITIVTAKRIENTYLLL